MLSKGEIRKLLGLNALSGACMICLFCFFLPLRRSSYTDEKGEIISAGSLIAGSLAADSGAEDEKTMKKKEEKREIAGIDDTMTRIYASLVVGNYSLDNGLVYSFSPEGTFSGYFDDKHPFVKNYQYEVVKVGVNSILNIYNDEKNAMVSYYIMLSDDADIILYYPEADFKILLE